MSVKIPGAQDTCEGPRPRKEGEDAGGQGRQLRETQRKGLGPRAPRRQAEDPNATDPRRVLGPCPAGNRKWNDVGGLNRRPRLFGCSSNFAVF